MKERNTFSEQLKEMAPPTLAWHLRKSQSNTLACICGTVMGVAGFSLSLWEGLNSPDEVYYKAGATAGLFIGSLAVILGSRIGISTISRSIEIIKVAHERGFEVRKISILPFHNDIRYFEN